MKNIPQEPDNLRLFRQAYPDVAFNSSYDTAKQDWKIDITVPEQNGTGRSSVLYWSNGSMLPESELENKKQYWTLLYEYPATLADPANFSETEIERLRSFGSPENRRSGAGTPMFFFDTLYDSGTRASLERHIVSLRFLGKTVRVHERLRTPLQRTEARIQKLAETSEEVRAFIAELKSIEGYYWRQISGTQRKSFHSQGIAIDILPVNLRGKAIYWSWTKNADPENWMLTPLSRRWMPPHSVIDAFEREGFIWGGKWGIWDNMHFEYHPELFAYRSRTLFFQRAIVERH